MRKIAFFITFLLCALMLSGCGKGPETPPASSERSASEAQTEGSPLGQLQKSIAENECMLGIGLFGYTDSEGDQAFVRQEVKNSALAKGYPFLADCVPVLTEGAELYAFVPANAKTAVTVYPAEISEDGNYIDRKDSPIYKGASGEAVILRCNLSEICANVLISVTDGKSTLEFHPTVSLKDGRLVQEAGCYDFSVYSEAARRLLLENGEVKAALERGMKLIYTGDTQTVDERDCLIFALGTDSGEQFVREQLYAVSDEIIYAYSVLTDSWEKIGAE